MYATCHPDRPMRARGLCHACYMKASRQGTLGGFDKTRKGASDRRDYWREWKRAKAAARKLQGIRTP